MRHLFSGCLDGIPENGPGNNLVYCANGTKGRFVRTLQTEKGWFRTVISGNAANAHCSENGIMFSYETNAENQSPKIAGNDVRKKSKTCVGFHKEVIEKPKTWCKIARCLPRTAVFAVFPDPGREGGDNY